jgi:hypothetical protein
MALAGGPPTLGQVALNRQLGGGAPGDQSWSHQDIAVTKVEEALGQDNPLGRTTHLLGEAALGTGSA